MGSSTQSGPGPGSPPALCLGLPAAGWAAGCGWYNLRLAACSKPVADISCHRTGLPTDYNRWFRALFIPNLYNYLFRPLRYAWKDFPFVLAPYINEKMWPWLIRQPEYYYSAEPVAGIFLSIPFFWLIVLPILRPLRAGWDWDHRTAYPAGQTGPPAGAPGLGG